MRVQYPRTAIDGSPHPTAFYQEAIPHSSDADFMGRYPYYQDPLCPSSVQCQFDHSGSTYFKPALTTPHCYQNAYDFENSNVAHELQQNQSQQRQQYCFDSVLDYQSHTSDVTGDWLPFGMVTQDTYQPTNPSLSFPQMASKIEAGHGGSHEGILSKAAVGGTSARSRSAKKSIQSSSSCEAGSTLGLVGHCSGGTLRVAYKL
eukprot:TsM_000955500 transcript=TsM_000955500 gene=TsM_000955500